MKTLSRSLKTMLLIALNCAALACVSGADELMLAGSAHATDLGCDFVDGRSNKIARVFSVTPTHVQVIYDGGQAGRKIPRHELPPELAAKFPYDAAKAAAYQQRQVAEAAARAAAQSAAARAASLKREQDLANEIERLNKQDQQLQSEITLARTLPRGNDKRAKITDKTNERQRIRDRITSLQTQSDELRTRRDAAP